MGEGLLLIHASATTFIAVAGQYPDAQQWGEKKERSFGTGN